MPQQLHRRIEGISIALIVLGILGMFQSANIDFYTWGFHLLLAGTLIFIVISHIPARVNDDEDLGKVP
jgi:hypothetical protein